MTRNKSNPKKEKNSYHTLSERIDILEAAQNLMWENHNNEKDPYKRVIILEKIVELQPSIWLAYYEIRKQLLEI